MGSVTRRRRLAAAILVCAVLAGAFASGCARKPAPATSGTAAQDAPRKVPRTALGNLPAAKSAVATLAPDARLLVVQMTGPRTAQGIPAWYFLFGSALKDETYLVMTAYGRPAEVREGSATLAPDEMAEVPGTSEWKVDSTEALTKAAAAAGASTGGYSRYLMGMETYKARSDTSTVEPFVWRVHFYPETSAGTTVTVDVNATTGAATVRK